MDSLTNYKLALLFVAAIVVPSALLALFSLRAISREREMSRAELRDRYRYEVEDVASALERRLFDPIGEIERGLAEAASRLRSATDLAEAARNLAGRSKVARAAALLLPSGEILDGVRGDAYSGSVRESLLVHERDGRVPALEARLELAAIARRAGLESHEIQALAELLGIVALHEEEMGTESARSYRACAIDRLRELGQDLPSWALGEAERAHRDREASRAFATALKGQILVRLKTILDQAAGRDVTESGYVVERSSGGPPRSVIFYCTVRARQPSPPSGSGGAGAPSREAGGGVGPATAPDGARAAAAPAALALFDVDLEHLRLREFGGETELVGADGRGTIRVVERGAAPLWSRAPEGGRQGDGAARGERPEELARRTLRHPLDYLDVVAFRRDASAADPLARLRDRVYVFAIGVALAGLAIGAFVMTRALFKELKAAELKSDFVATVTHELKTPLTSIGMFAETLLMGRVSDKAEARECLEIIAKETERLTRLIDRVLTFSKIEARKKRFDLKLNDMAALVGDTIKIFRTQLKGASKPYTLDVSVVQDLPKVLCDRQAIEEVLLNLLSNAYKYGGESPRIHVTTTKRRRWVVVEVRDWGIGIPWREQRKVFRKFYRADDALTREVEGSGIGLTLARSIARAHRGDITVRSKVGHGSAFSLWLPR